MGQSLLLIMERFSQIGQTGGRTCGENTTKCEFIKRNIFAKTNVHSSLNKLSINYLEISIYVQTP